MAKRRKSRRQSGDGSWLLLFLIAGFIYFSQQGSGPAIFNQAITNFQITSQGGTFDPKQAFIPTFNPQLGTEFKVEQVIAQLKSLFPDQSNTGTNLLAGLASGSNNESIQLPLQVQRPEPAGHNPQIIGSPSFVSTWETALAQLKRDDPENWSYAVQRINVIQESGQSGMDVPNRIFNVNASEQFPSGIAWIACTLPHEACHVDQGFASGSPERERACFPIEITCLQRLHGSEYLINQLRNADGTHIYR